MFNKTAIWLLEIIGVLVVFSSFIHAAPPLNDSFASPVILSGFPTNNSGSNVDATLEQDEPSPKSMAGDVGASVWFRWTATFTGPVQIDTSGSSFDTILAVWKGVDLDRLTELASNDDHGGETTSAVFISTEVGVTYTVAVYGYLGDTGLVVLNISPDLSSCIAGTVTGPDGTTPLEGIIVTAVVWNNEYGGYWNVVSADSTDASGHYRIEGLAAETYRVEFVDQNNGDFAREIYGNAMDLDWGTDIIVPAEKTVTGIDASMAKASRIAGVVTGPNGTTPLKGIQVGAYRWTNTQGGYWYVVSSADTDSNGKYSIGGLAAGTYRVDFYDQFEDYLIESYADTVDLDLGTEIFVPEGETVTGIDASLAKASRIAGVVTGPDGITPLKGIEVIAYHWVNTKGGHWEVVYVDYSGTSGSYSIGNLAAGTYRVEFLDWENGDYARKIYGNAQDLESGTDIVVPAATIVAGIDASLSKASRIAGTVTGPDGITPLEEIGVAAYRLTNTNSGYREVASWGFTDTRGNYSIGGLAAGTYRLEFIEDRGNYATKFYANGIDFDSGTDILVPADQIVTGIDVSLASAVQPQSAVIVSFQLMSAGWFEIRYTGKIGKTYIIQKSQSLGVWMDQSPHSCQTGVNIVRVTSSEPGMFWQLKEAP